MTQIKEQLLLQPNILESIIKDPGIRAGIARDSHFLFHSIYLAETSDYETADFQREMFALSEDLTNQNIFIEAFRGSAKSTIMNTSLILWSVLGKPQNKFILILGQTQEQARHHLKNIRIEIEKNELLRSDLGPFREEEDEWKSQAIVIPKYGAKIMAVSADQAVRGFRFGKYRPQLIVADDLEDSQSVKTQEGRDKIFNWLTIEILPAGEPTSRLVVIGNLLHDDGLLRRMQKGIESGERNGIFRRYPLMDEQGKVLWPGKYPNEGVIEAQRKQIGNDIAWQQEYLLNYVDDTNQVIKRGWVQYYDVLPDIRDKKAEYRYVALAVDPAISEKQTADYTAMVGAIVCGWGKDFRIYILPFPINERMDHPKTIEKIKSLYTTLIPGQRSRIYIEEVAYQAALTQRLQQEERIPAEGIKIQGSDKRARLSIISPHIQHGVVLFPRRGAEALIQQVVGFGNEKHDDLCDAFTMLLTKITEEPINRPGGIIYVGGRPGIMSMRF